MFKVGLTKPKIKKEDSPVFEFPYLEVCKLENRVRKFKFKNGAAELLGASSDKMIVLGTQDLDGEFVAYAIAATDYGDCTIYADLSFNSKPLRDKLNKEYDWNDNESYFMKLEPLGDLAFALYPVDIMSYEENVDYAEITDNDFFPDFPSVEVQTVDFTE